MSFPSRSLHQKVTSENELESTRRTPQKSVSRGKRLSTKHSPGKLFKKSPAKSPGKGSAQAKSCSKSLKNFFVGPISSEKTVGKTVDDSFHIDLPPASQLDVSVLAALPSDMCQKILEGYTEPEKVIVPNNEGFEKNNPTMERSSTLVQMGRMENADVVTKPLVHPMKHKSTTRPSALERRWKESRKSEIVVGDERVFLSSWKKYIAKLCISSHDGSPTSGDCERTADYLCKLAATNLEMTELCLKSFRRFLEMQLLESPWTPAFNAILGQVQGRVKFFYGGVLKIEPL